MEIILDFPPMPSEVEDQLARMLGSPRFANAMNPSDFLKLVVTRKLEGKYTTGSVIAKAMFKDKFVRNVSNDVRQTAVNLRRTLERYYALEGKGDFVKIALPPIPEDRTIRPVDGKTYTPSFSYNPSSEVLFAVRVGYIWMGRWGYYAQLRAFEIFTDCLRRTPNHIAPTLGLVETICNFSDRAWTHPEGLDYYTSNLKLLKAIPSPPSDYWRLWAVRGHVELRDGSLRKAGTAFEKAVSLNRAQTEAYLPYIEYPRTIGQVDRALVLMNNYLGLHLEEREALAHIARFLISIGRVQPGIQHLEQALDIDAGNCAAHEMLAMVGLLHKDVSRVVGHIKMLSILQDQKSYGLFLVELKKLEKKLGFEETYAKALKELGYDESFAKALEVEANVSSSAIAKS